MRDIVRVARARKALLVALEAARWAYNEADDLATRILERRAAWIEDGCMLSEEVKAL